MSLILSDKDSRIVLWGCQIGSDWLVAELGFFDANLYSNSYLLTTSDRQTRVLVQVPDNLKSQMFPAKTQNISLAIISQNQ